MSAPRHSLKLNWKKRLILLTVPYLAASLLKLVALTCRKEIRNAEVLQPLDEGGRLVGGFWHETVALVACLMKNTGFHTLTSHSYDGELAARTVEAFGMRVQRGSSSRGGLQALTDMTEAMKIVPGLGFNIDGPRGPRRVSKPGLAMLSARTDIPIIPVAAAINHAWRLRSWDRFIIPRPFSRMVFLFGEPIAPPKSQERAEIQSKTLEIQNALNELQAKLETELGQEPYWPDAAPDA